MSPHGRETQLPSAFQAYSVTYFHSEIQESLCIGAADLNSASQQPTSHRNRRLEAADDAGIAKLAGDGT